MDSKLKNGHILGMKFMIAAWLLASIGFLTSYFIYDTVGKVLIGIGVSCGLIGTIFYITGHIETSNNSDDKWQ